MRKIILFITIFISAISCFAQESSNANLKNEILSVLKNKKATVGVAVIYDGHDTLVINNQYKYPTMSVYKFYEALAVLDYLNKNKLPLETKVEVTQKDLRPNTYSPLRDSRSINKFDISIADLLKYSVAESDNNACDILFRYVGGTQYVNSYIKQIGVEETLISATEEEMDKNDENQYLNWTKPLSAAYALDKFVRTDLLSKEYKDFLLQTLIQTTTGKDKIKSLLPPSTIVGHKTGTSSRTDFGIKVADNDIGFVILPSQKLYTIAIFVMNSFEDDKTNAGIIANVSKVVYDYYTDNK